MRGAAVVPGLFPTSLEACFAPIRIPQDPKRAGWGLPKEQKPRWDGRAARELAHGDAWHVAPLQKLLKRRDGAGWMQVGCDFGESRAMWGLYALLHPTTMTRDHQARCPKRSR